MPTAMSYAIDTLLRLCEENTRLRMRLGEPSREECNIKLDVVETEEEKDWATLQSIPTDTITQYLAEECCLHIYITPPPEIQEVERLKESADLIAESQQKQIDLLIEDKRERMEDRERLLKRICELEEEVGSHKGRGRPKKTECSPCIGDPSV